MDTDRISPQLDKQHKGMTPSAIVRYLDQYVVGQEGAKKTLAVAVYSHFKKLQLGKKSEIELAKSNILLIGPTGSGKTLLCETLSRGLDVPFVTADATSLTQTKYVNEEIEAILVRLLDRAEGDVAKAQQGIVFIDEIDKLKAQKNQTTSTSGESVQYALLKMMEGSHVRISSGHTLDTTNILFICGGAFVGLDHITAKTHAYGFIATSDNDNQKIFDRLNARIKPTDLFEFGLIPEFTGRLPVIANLDKLSKPMMMRIMTEPRNSLYNQFREVFRDEGVELRVDPLVFEQMAELAFEYKVGARSLRGIFEELATPVLYQIPDRPEIRQVHFTSLFEEATLVIDAAVPGKP